MDIIDFDEPFDWGQWNRTHRSVDADDPPGRTASEYDEARRRNEGRVKRSESAKRGHDRRRQKRKEKTQRAIEPD